MRKTRSILPPGFWLICVFLMSSCGGGKTEKESSTANDLSTTTESYPRTALGAFFQVNDINQWNQVYEREVSEETRIGSLQSMENPKMIFVMQWSASHEAARELAGDPETRKIMQEGGMISDPQFRYYDVKYYNEDLSEESYRLAVTAEVLNYEMWKNDFDRDEPKRKEAGLNLIGLATDADNKNLVYILFSTDDQTKVYEFLSSEETKQAISDSGVIGEPNMTWWKQPGAANVIN